MSDERPDNFANLVSAVGPVQALFIFVGLVIVIFFGLQVGVNLQNRTLMIGVALCAAGIAGHYWPDIRSMHTHGEPAVTNWGNLFLAVLYSGACGVACWFAYFGR